MKSLRLSAIVGAIGKNGRFDVENILVGGGHITRLPPLRLRTAAKDGVSENDSAERPHAEALRQHSAGPPINEPHKKVSRSRKNQKGAEKIRQNTGKKQKNSAQAH